MGREGLGIARNAGDAAILAKLLSLAATIASMRREYERSNSELGRNREVRLALGESIRRHDLVRSTVGRFAQPAECLLPPGILGHDAGRRSRPKELEEAAELLKQKWSAIALEFEGLDPSASSGPIFCVH